ncbi:MAG: hypothetical protein KF874_10355 [Rhizobiaceae bacterium]|nr:hypothetical protein [Rhizobiaceae bacterium]
MRAEKWLKHWIVPAREEFIKHRDYIKRGLFDDDDELEAAEQTNARLE